MAIKQFDYENPNNEIVEDAPTSRIVPFKYEEVDVKQPVAQVPVTPPLTQTKPQFKKFSELSTKDKIDLGFNRLGLKVGSGVGAMTASTIKSLSYGKDLIKGTFSGSTISEELANDTTFDKKVKGFADEYQRLTSQGMSEQLSQKKAELGLDPNDQFTDKVFEGLGSLFGFVGTGFASKIGSVAVGFGKYAPVVASGVNTLGESLTEAQDVYETVKAEGGDDKKAFEAFRSTLAGNALLIGLTNKLGGMFDDTLYQGIKRAVKVGFSGTMEGFQEGYQTLLSNANTGKPLFDGVKESFLIGTILGAPASAALDFGDRSKAKEQIDAMDVPQEQKDVAKAIVDKTATEEEISQAFTQAVTNPESGISVDENVTTTLKEDVQTLLDQGQNIGEVVIALQEEGIKKSDAENIVAEILANQQQQAETPTIEAPEKGGLASPEIKTLDEEAKKYKTVDEFIASQGKPVYRTPHGEEINTSKFTKDDMLGDVMFFADKEETAKMYGKTAKEAFVDIKKPFVISEKTPDDIGQVALVRSYGGKEKFRQYLKDNGYDGIIIEKGYGNEILAFDKKQIKTKKELTDLYENVNKSEDKKTVENRGIASPEIKTLEQEAKKYKSVEDFVKAQGETLYSGSKAKFEQFDFTKADKGGLYGNSVYMTPDAKRALTYGENVTEYVVPKNAKLLKESDFESRVRSITPSVPYGDITVARAKAVEQFIKEGYDGVKTKDTTAIFNPKALQTKAQLTDIYNKTKKPSVKSSLQKIFDKFKALKKGEKVPNPNEIIKTEYELADIIKKTIKIDNPNVVFTGKTLKHIAEKKENGQVLFEAIPEILKNPTEIRQGETGNRYLVVADIATTQHTGKTAVSLEIQIKGNNIIITAFPADNEYLKNFDLLWSTADSSGSTSQKRTPPSQQEVKPQGGSSRFSDLREDQNIQDNKPKEIVTKPKEEVKDNTYKLSDEKRKGIRSVAKNLEDKAKELGISIEDSYEMKRFVEEVAISEQYLENNKDKIDDILDGSFPYPKDVSKTAFIHTIIENAKANNDTKMLTKAYNALAEEGTTAGQNIAFINSIYKTYDETSPETYLNKIRAERESMAFRKDWKLKNPFAIDEKKKEFIKKRTQRQKAIKTGVKDRTTVKIKELENILESFMC